MKKISLNNQKELSIQEAFEQFQRYNQVKNLAPATIRFYQNHFSSFLAYLDNNTLPISSINSDVIDTYMLYLHTEKALSSTTVNIHLRAMRVFLYFYMERGYLKHFKIRQIKAETKVKEPYSEVELQLILQKPNMKTTTFAKYRNWVIVNFLLATGCRASTLVNIKINDLD